MKKCIVCGKRLHEDVCEACFGLLNCKYQTKKQLKEAIKWHKEYMKEIQEEQDGQ
jgi:hypothetical protein